MAAADPEVRRAAAYVGGIARAASRTRDQHAEAMAEVRAARRRNLAERLDPDGSLARTDPDELERRIDLAIREHLARAGLRSAQARAARRAAARQAEEDLVLGELAAGGAA